MSKIQEFHELEELIYKVMHNLHLPPPHDDYFQESYLVYHAAKARYDPGKSRFSTYFHTKLRYHYQTLVSNDLKRTAAHRRLYTLSSFTNPLPSTHPALPSTLSPFEKRFLSDLLNGYKNVEIADRMNISSSTFYRRRRILRTKLARLYM
ncbi:hypothetical protein [Halobacillus sp. Cin3]|uniref:hypothetical protein n=1 Tax=Halobacillus sp. Cin3 TaxID=2928441 RepID=UPI00248F2B86|nr:hypothetical protein [Halobacillus sp. Cin3]